MIASEQLDSYLARFTHRLKLTYIARGSAVLAAVILIISVSAAWLAVDAGFASNVVITGRLVLLVAVAAVIYLLYIQPIKSLDKQRIREIEARTPELNGRVETYYQVSDDTNPFKELLAEDAFRISDTVSAEQRFEQKEFTGRPCFTNA